MSPLQGFELRPGAAQDIFEIWQFIAEQHPHAATHVREISSTLSENLLLSLARATSDTISLHSLCGSKRNAIASSFTRPMKNGDLNGSTQH
jgi:hypothetical protein